jgi:hypothetical protein
MPFELGLAVAWSAERPSHKWFILEQRNYRVSKSLSDVDGSHVYIHEGTAIGVLKQLTNALSRQKRQPSVTELKGVYRDVRRAAAQIKQEHAANDLFAARPFRELVYAATLSAKNRIGTQSMNQKRGHNSGKRES